MGLSYLILSLAALQAVTAFEVNLVGDSRKVIDAGIGEGLTVAGGGTAALLDDVEPFGIVSQANFVDGPQNFASGLIMTTGRALDAVPGTGEPSYDGKMPGITFCRSPVYSPSLGNFFDGTYNYMFLNNERGYSKIRGSLIFATQEPEGGSDDIMQIFFGHAPQGGVETYVDDAVVIKDQEGNVVPQPISAQSEWFTANAITPPESGLRYARSTPLLSFEMDVIAPTDVQVVLLAICDEGDGLRDSALLLRLGGVSEDQGSDGGDEADGDDAGGDDDADGDEGDADGDAGDGDNADGEDGVGGGDDGSNNDGGSDTTTTGNGDEGDGDNGGDGEDSDDQNGDIQDGGNSKSNQDDKTSLHHDLEDDMKSHHSQNQTARPVDRPGPGDWSKDKVYDFDGRHLITTCLTTTITYVTVCPTDEASLITTKYLYSSTITCKEDNVPTTLPPCPVTTTKVACHGCGSKGEDEVALTIPIGVAESTPPPVATRPGKDDYHLPHHGDTTPAPEYGNDPASHKGSGGHDGAPYTQPHADAPFQGKGDDHQPSNKSGPEPGSAPDNDSSISPAGKHGAPLHHGDGHAPLPSEGGPPPPPPPPPTGDKSAAPGSDGYPCEKEDCGGRPSIVPVSGSSLLVVSSVHYAAAIVGILSLAWPHYPF